MHAMMIFGQLLSKQVFCIDDYKGAMGVSFFVVDSGIYSVVYCYVANCILVNGEF